MVRIKDITDTIRTTVATDEDGEPGEIRLAPREGGGWDAAAVWVRGGRTEKFGVAATGELERKAPKPAAAAVPTNSSGADTHAAKSAPAQRSKLRARR